MKRLFLGLIFTLFFIAEMWAVKANPMPMTFKQNDGTSVLVKLHGDEHFHYMTTIDGVLVVNTGKGIYVARITEDNTLVATNQLAHNVGERSNEEEAIIAMQDKEGFLSSNIEKLEGARAKMNVINITRPALFPHMGNPRCIVLLVDFTDCKFTVGDPVRNFDQYLNKVGYGKGTMELIPDDNGVTHRESSNYCSVSEYFDHCSNGAFRPVFDVFDQIIHLDHNMAYYGGNQEDGKDDNTSALIKDACNKAGELGLDFSPYATIASNTCDLVYIIYAGYGENSGAPANTLWAKSGYTSGSWTTVNGIGINRYGISCELYGNPNSYNPPRINTIGLFCHEFSHTMGMPDFYYTNSKYMGVKDNQGMEYWSIMDFGYYIGVRPSPYTAWERNDMGWFDNIQTVTEPIGTYTLKPMDDEDASALRIVNPNNTNEYFILENIQKTKSFYGDMLGHGLQITHVNYEGPAFALTANSVNNVKNHPRMTVIPADGELFSTYHDDYDANTLRELAAGDFFPGTSSVTQMSKETNLPNFAWFTNTQNGSVSESSPTFENNLMIKNICEEENGDITFEVILDTTTGVKNVTNYVNKSNKTYNLNGQEVNNNFHGIIIKGGRKYVK